MYQNAKLSNSITINYIKLRDLINFPEGKESG